MSHELLKKLDNVELPKMTIGERLVFSHLCFLARKEDNFAFMSTKNLQKRTGINHRTSLNKIIRNLIEMGAISRTTGLYELGKKSRYVPGMTINLYAFDGTNGSTPENSQFYPLEPTALPNENPQFQHIKTVIKQPKTSEVAGGQTSVRNLENLEKKLEEKIGKKFLKNSVEKLVYDELEKKLKEEVEDMILPKKKEMPNPYMNLKAEDIAKLKIKTEPPVKKIHAGTLCTVWEMCHAEFYPDIFIGHPTMAERGMFKNFLKFATEHHAIAALYFAVKYWITFVKFCQKNGAVGKPTTPKIKYLLKYVKQSVTFYLSKQNAITGVYAGTLNSQPTVKLMEPDGKVVYQEVKKESGSESISDVPMNSEEANELYKKLFQKGKK